MRGTNKDDPKRHAGAKRILGYERGFLPCIWSACARRASVRRQQISCSLKDGRMTGSNSMTKEALTAYGSLPKQQVHADPPLRGIIRLHTGVPLGKVAKYGSLECGTMPNRSSLSMAFVPTHRAIVQ